MENRISAALDLNRSWFDKCISGAFCFDLAVHHQHGIFLLSLYLYALSYGSRPSRWHDGSKELIPQKQRW
jgi:hypothetical protein